MSIFNVDDVFSYVFPTSSVEYIRNYNFNPATITNLPLTLINTGSVVPLTVDISTTDSWVRIYDAQTQTPVTSVILNPASSRNIIVKIDLPEEIENSPGSSVTIRPSILLDIKSGSIAPPPPTPEDEPPTENVPPDRFIPPGDDDSSVPPSPAGDRSNPSEQEFV